MLAEAFPFWSRHWYYLVLGLISLCFINFVSRKVRKELCSNVAINNHVNKNITTLINDNDEDKDVNDDENENLVPALPENLQHIPYIYSKPSAIDMKRRACEFFDITNARRTIRYFSTETVPREVIRDIIRAAGMNLYYYKPSNKLFVLR